MLTHISIWSLLNTKNTKTCLKRRVLVLWWNINDMIAWLIAKKVHNLHLNSFTIVTKWISNTFENAFMKILENDSLNIPNLQLVPQSYLSRKIWVLMNVSMFWFQLIIIYHPKRYVRKSYLLSYCSYLVPIEKNTTYIQQQCDMILKPKHFQLQTLLITPNVSKMLLAESSTGLNWRNPCESWKFSFGVKV
jgi:hypothetical protein